MRDRNIEFKKEIRLRPGDKVMVSVDLAVTNDLDDDLVITGYVWRPTIVRRLRNEDVEVTEVDP